MNEIPVNEERVEWNATDRVLLLCVGPTAAVGIEALLIQIGGAGSLVRWAPASPSPPACAAPGRSEFRVESRAANLLCHS